MRLSLTKLSKITFRKSERDTRKEYEQIVQLNPKKLLYFICED